MKLKYIYYPVLIIILVLEGCGYANMTYFRKHQATIEDERRDWGLCGGNFLPNGNITASMDAKVLKCMSKKGYETINDYYEEQHIGFVNREDPGKLYIDSQVLQECGFEKRKEKNSICPDYYIYKSKLSAVVACMSRKGFDATPPRYKHGFRIIDGLSPPDPLFCTSLTPRNKKGGVSLGDSRLE